MLTFHQGMWELLHLIGLMPPHTLQGGPPFGVPRTVDLCFWGGVWGVVLGLVLLKLPETYPTWVRGLRLGIATALIDLFIVPLIKVRRWPEVGPLWRSFALF